MHMYRPAKMVGCTYMKTTELMYIVNVMHRNFTYMYLYTVPAYVTCVPSPQRNSTRLVYTKHRRVDVLPLTSLILHLPLMGNLVPICSQMEQEKRREYVMPGLSSYCSVSVMDPIRKVGLYSVHMAMCLEIHAFWLKWHSESACIFCEYVFIHHVIVHVWFSTFTHM